MRFFAILFAALGLSALAVIPAFAAEYKFSSSIDAPDVKISTITVSLSEDVANEDVRWGPRDIELLKKALVKKVSNRLHRKKLMGKNAARLELIIVDITSNRPTLREMTKRSELEFVSFGLGGAEIEAHLIAADGTDLGEMHYRYYENQLYGFSAGASTWYDARHAFDNFSRRLVKVLRTQVSS